MFKPIAMPISKKVPSANGGNEYQEIGKVTANVPLLDEFGIQAEIKVEDGEKVYDEDGLPIYTDDKANWLLSAAVQSIKMTARNKLIPGTIELRDNAVIAENWEQLLAESGNRGEALKLIAEIKKSYASFINTLDKSPQVKSHLIGLFGNKQALALQTSGTKEKFANYVQQYAESLEEETLTRYSRYLQGLEEVCSADTPELEGL